MLTGCASMNQKEESIGDIIEKENTLIGKVQAERATPEVQQGVSQNASLKVSEDHLGLALQELLKANEVITTKLIQQNEKEVDFDRFGGRELQSDDLLRKRKLRHPRGAAGATWLELRNGRSRPRICSTNSPSEFPSARSVKNPIRIRARRHLSSHRAGCVATGPTAVNRANPSLESDHLVASGQEEGRVSSQRQGENAFHERELPGAGHVGRRPAPIPASKSRDHRG